MDSPETYISLYAGGAGLDMGFKRAVSGAQCIALVEHEASAAALLVDHVEAEEEPLDACPVWTDAFTFPAERFHGLVDWIIGGPPCQPFSVAGKRRGADDPRNLWPLTLRMVGQVQPRGCFFENVPSADSLWYIYETVIPGLRYLGYEVEAGIFSAAEVGAPHNRERIFILAYRERGQLDQPQAGSDVERGVLPPGGRQQGADGVAARSGELADAGHEPTRSRAEPRRPELVHLGTCDATGTGRTPLSDELSGAREQASPIDAPGRRMEFPPGPGDDWSNVPERLWPAVKLEVCRMADELPGRVDALSRSQKLRILGNGVVPATAERAFHELWKQMK